MVLPTSIRALSTAAGAADDLTLASGPPKTLEPTVGATSPHEAAPPLPDVADLVSVVDMVSPTRRGAAAGSGSRFCVCQRLG